MKLEEALRSLLQIPAVSAAFIVSERGHVLYKQVPESLDETALSLAGERITRLCDALDQRDSVVEWAILRFERHRVCVHRMGAALLCVVATAEVDPSSLRTAMNGVCVRLEPAVHAAIQRTHKVIAEALAGFDPAGPKPAEQRGGRERRSRSRP